VSGSAAPLAVLQVMRRPFPLGNHSIEGLFDTVREHLPPTVQVTVGMAPRVSQGWGNRLANLRWMRGARLPVTHITGDVTYLAAALPRRGTIITIHDVGWTPRSPLNRALFDLIWIRMPVARAERVTVVSEQVRQDVLAITGADPAKVCVIPNCVHPAFTPGPARPVGAAAARRPVVLQVGTSANKNVERVAAALEGLDCELHVVGALSDVQVAALRRHGVAYRVSVNLTRDGIVAAYREADVLVFVSTFEGFGMPILEGQGTGCPVVTSNIAPMREVAGAGAALVEPRSPEAIGAAVRRVLEDRGWREALRERGFANVARYGAATVAAEYAALYHEVAAASDQAPARQAGAVREPVGAD
jgi:glycosyltransferase involved in cell wall biosynthesis